MNASLRDTKSALSTSFLASMQFCLTVCLALSLSIISHECRYMMCQKSLDMYVYTPHESIKHTQTELSLLCLEPTLTQLSKSKHIRA